VSGACRRSLYFGLEYIWPTPFERMAQPPVLTIAGQQEISIFVLNRGAFNETKRLTRCCKGSIYGLASRDDHCLLDARMSKVFGTQAEVQGSNNRNNNKTALDLY
jgi:hypothetical protein